VQSVPKRHVASWISLVRYANVMSASQEYVAGDHHKSRILAVDYALNTVHGHVGDAAPDINGTEEV
jgi:hypothetical protein